MHHNARSFVKTETIRSNVTHPCTHNRHQNVAVLSGVEHTCVAVVVVVVVVVAVLVVVVVVVVVVVIVVVMVVVVAVVEVVVVLLVVVVVVVVVFALFVSVAGLDTDRAQYVRSLMGRGQTVTSTPGAVLACITAA
ncbi:hypothetical protein ElyMa_000866300 [Elysia marginata]|uniref:ABC transmembrane type-1 domain-containing protein n=1 Tax=Elysia marginata TaxID=1093978 RepID=A0AAV4H4E7_9GAST|nr:hypothetical protein ElyMa_000866300 [Elysia marginata]